MSDSTVIVTTKTQLDALVTAAVDRAVARHAPTLATPARDRPGVGYLTNREAMSALGVSKATLARWRADGTLPFSKIGNSLYYAVDDVEASLAARRVRRAA